MTRVLTNYEKAIVLDARHQSSKDFWNGEKVAENAKITIYFKNRASASFYMSLLHLQWRKEFPGHIISWETTPIEIIEYNI